MSEDQSRRLSDNLKRESDKITWWDGNSTRVWRCSMFILLSLVSFLGSWMFLTVIEMSNKFVIREEYQLACIRMEDKLDKLNDRLLGLYSSNYEVSK